jgi:hypothetical protein
MGFLTTITIHNDALHHFKNDPKQFAEKIFEAMAIANMRGMATDAMFSDGKAILGGYIEVQPSRHADDETVFVHRGNTVLNINRYNTDFKDLVARCPEVAQRFVDTAQRIVDGANELIKSKKQT